MTCREFIEFVWRYVDEDLRPEERVQFEAHLADCPDCIKYLRSYGDTMRAGRIAFRDLDESVPAGVPEELIQAVLASRACLAYPACSSRLAWYRKVSESCVRW